MTDLAVTVADGVALLTLNRLERRNAYTASMGAQLSRATVAESSPTTTPDPTDTSAVLAMA